MDGGRARDAAGPADAATAASRVPRVSVIVEIRAAEGGRDAKDLVGEQFALYARFCAAHRL